MIGEAQVRIWMVEQGADPDDVVAAVGYNLTEDLEGVKVMRDWSPEGNSGGTHRHIVYHPDKGMLGVVNISDQQGTNMDTAEHASMTIKTFQNPNAAGDVRPQVRTKTGVTTHGNTGMGPSYKLGPAQVRGVLRHLKTQYPLLKRISNSTRVTGVKTDHSAEINLERGAGPLRGVQALRQPRAPRTASPAGWAAVGGGTPAHTPNSRERDTYHAVLTHHGWSTTDATGEDWHHPFIGDMEHTVHLRPGHGQAGDGWSHTDERGVPLQNHRLSGNAGGLDSYLTQLHGETSADPSAHTPFFSGQNQTQMEYASVLAHHGWNRHSPRTFHHQDHPGHAIEMHRGNWRHDNEAGEPDSTTGAIPVIDHGVQPAELDAHLTHWHQMNNRGPDGTHPDSFHEVLTHHGWEHQDQATPPHYTHNHFFDSRVDVRQGEGWSHTDVDHSEVFGTGTTARELDGHLTRIHNDPVSGDGGHRTRYDEFGSSADLHPTGQVQHMHAALRRRGWQVSRNNGPLHPDYSTWRHPEQPDHRVIVSHTNGFRGPEGYGFEVRDSEMQHVERGGFHHQIEGTLDSWYPTSAATGPRTIPTHGTHPTTIPTHSSYSARQDPQSDLRQSHQELRDHGWQTGAMHDENHLGMSAWHHPNLPDHQIRLSHLPDDDGDLTFKHYENGEHVGGGTTTELPSHLGSIANHAAIRAGQDNLIHRSTLEAHGYRRTHTDELGEHFAHSDGAITAILHPNGSWSHTTPEYANRRGTTNADLQNHLTNEIHGPHNVVHQSMRNTLATHGYERTEQGSHYERWEHPGTGHQAELDRGSWKVDHPTLNEHPPTRSDDPGELLHHLTNVHARQRSRDILANQGWARIPDVTSAHFPGSRGPILHHPENPGWGRIHLNGQAGLPGHESEAHFVHQPLRIHGNEFESHGFVDQLSHYLDGVRGGE